MNKRTRLLDALRTSANGQHGTEMGRETQAQTNANFADLIIQENHADISEISEKKMPIAILGTSRKIARTSVHSSAHSGKDRSLMDAQGIRAATAIGAGTVLTVNIAVVEAEEMDDVN